MIISAAKCEAADSIEDPIFIVLKTSAMSLATAVSDSRFAFADGPPICGVQLGCIANVEYGDHFIALEKGFFEDAGLNVKVSPGRPRSLIR